MWTDFAVLCRLHAVYRLSCYLKCRSQMSFLTTQGWFVSNMYCLDHDELNLFILKKKFWKCPPCALKLFFIKGMFNFLPMPHQCLYPRLWITASSTSKTSITVMFHHRLAIHCGWKKSHWFDPIPSHFFVTYQNECQVRPMGGATWHFHGSF